MTEYVAQCRTGLSDTITARIESDAVELVAEHRGSRMMETFLSADGARTFARGILALADEVDGGEAKEPLADWERDLLESSPIKVGDRIRILTSGSRGARVKAGETYTVRKVTESEVQVDGDGSNGRWYLSPDDVVVVDEAKPAPPADALTVPTRAALLSQARDLMAGEDYTAHDLIALANYLAGESA